MRRYTEERVRDPVGEKKCNTATRGDVLNGELETLEMEKNAENREVLDVLNREFENYRAPRDTPLENLEHRPPRDRINRRPE